MSARVNTFYRYENRKNKRFLSILIIKIEAGDYKTD